MSPYTTGLLVTMSQLLVALLPTTRKSPSARQVDPVATITVVASSNAFMASLPRAGRAG
jgi:hypothetical protein